MRRGWRVRAAVVGTVVAAAGGAVLGGGGAAAAASPILLGSCAMTTSGVPGQPVTLAGSSLVGPVAAALDALVLGAPLAAQAAGVLTPLQIPLGTVPTSSTVISGAHIAESTAAALKGTPLDQPSALGAITSALSSACAVAVNVANTAGGAVLDVPGALTHALPVATSAVASLSPHGAAGPAAAAPQATAPTSGSPARASGAPTSAGASGSGSHPTYTGGVDRAQLGDLLAPWAAGERTQYSFGRVPLYSYAGTPYAVAGGAGLSATPTSLYGSAVAGYVATAGVLDPRLVSDEVAKASQSQALEPAAALNPLGGLTVLATLLLAGTSAAAVRAGTVRRTLARTGV